MDAVEKVKLLHAALKEVQNEHLEACTLAWPVGSVVEFSKGNGRIRAAIVSWSISCGSAEAIVRNVKTGATHRIQPGYDLGAR